MLALLNLLLAPHYAHMSYLGTIIAIGPVLQIWDGIGSVTVGVLLAGVAAYLIQRNRSFLIGRSMTREDFQKIVRHLQRDPVIKNIYEAKSEEIGEGIFRCDLSLQGCWTRGCHATVLAQTRLFTALLCTRRLLACCVHGATRHTWLAICTASVSLQPHMRMHEPGMHMQLQR